MLRPFHQTKSKKLLKIDQYKIKMHKHSEGPGLSFIAKSILLQKQKGQQNQKREQTKKVTYVSENHDTNCHCTREERHRTAEKKRMIFRVKKSFTTHKYFQSKKSLNKQDDLTQKSQNFSPNSLQKMTEAIVQVMKKNESIIQKDENKLQIVSQNFSKLIKYFISLGRRKSKYDLQNVQGDQVKQQDRFLKQLSQIIKNQQIDSKSQNESSHSDQNMDDFNFQVQKRNKQNILRDIQKKIDSKTAELVQIQQTITNSKTVMQKFQNKKRQIKQNAILKNEQYLKQLCLEYKKHSQDIYSFSVFIETWQAKNNVKISRFEHIEQNVKEQFTIINDFLSKDNKKKIQLDFVRDFLLRVMNQFRVKYTQLQRLVEQKTQWISQILSKNKKQAQFVSFKQEFLQNLKSQFSLNFLQSENKLKFLKKKIQIAGSQKSNSDVLSIIEQVQAFLRRMNQNYLLNHSFH